VPEQKRHQFESGFNMKVV